MLVSSYSNNGLNDVLIIELKQSAKADQDFERQGNIARLYNRESNETVGFNFFNASSLLSFEEDGPVTLSEEDIDVLNKALDEEGFKQELEADASPKFVVGLVKELEPMEDSDHLNITQTEIDGDAIVQIVCGAKNVAQGQKVVVAKPGAIMPDGSIIWPGQLRGMDSFGMISSAYELGLDPEHEQKGILVLDDDATVGEAFDFNGKK